MVLSLRYVSLAVVLSIACASSVARRAGAQDTRPRLLVFITIDQLRPDYLQRFDHQLTGGFRRLLDGGAVFLDGYHDHAITETAPGHAAVLSGRFPVRTGIAFNAGGVNDVPNADVLGAPEEPTASPARFRGTTLIDWIRAADPRARVLSVSRKDRGAILPVGRSRAPVFWWAASNGTFTTSRYYADSLPDWVQRFNGRRMAQRHAGSAWSLLLADTAYREPDSVATENRGRPFVFPHLAPNDSATAARVAGAFPWMDEMTLALALEGLTELELGRANDRTDVLAVSLSTTDAIGHAYGPDSREMHDNILRLDRALGVFFDSLFALRDSGRVVVALTSDHGVSPIPGSRSVVDANSDAAVVSLAEPLSRFRKRLAARRVDSLGVALVEGLVVVTNPAAFARARVDPDSAIATFGADAMRVKGVLRADLFTTMAGADTVQDAIARRWLHMFAPGGAVRMAVTLTPFSYWAPAPYPTHGSPHDVDARVPIFFYGAGVRPGRVGLTVRVVDIAPTLAAILGVKPLEPIDGRLLKSVVQ